MSKKVSTKIFSAIMVMALAVSANVSGYMGGFDDDRAHVNLNVGSKMISLGNKFNFYENNAAVYNDDLQGMRSQTQFGLDLDYKFDVLPFHVAVGYHASSSEKGISKLSLSELRLGARKYQDFDMFSIYYGGGLSSVTTKVERDRYLVTAAIYKEAVSETASTLGLYGEVGGLYNVTEAIYVGANVTYTIARVEFEKFHSEKEKTYVGGAQIGLVVGYAF